MTLSNRTLVIMAKAPRLGSVKTRLAKSLSLQAAGELYRCFLADIGCTRLQCMGERSLDLGAGSRGPILLPLREKLPKLVSAFAANSRQELHQPLK